MSETTKLVIDEEILESLVGLAIRVLDCAMRITDPERQVGQVIAPGVETAMIHLGLRTAAEVFDRKAFPAGVPPEIRALTAAAADRIAVEFAAVPGKDA
jgi:hypothetical protein